MSKTTTPMGGSPLDQEMAEVRQQLQSLRGAMALLRERLGRDETPVGGSLGRALTELRQLMRTTMETEQAFEKRRTEKEGDREAKRLDLDAARDSIGRRLDRLRAAQCARDLPE